MSRSTGGFKEKWLRPDRRHGSFSVKHKVSGAKFDGARSEAIAVAVERPGGIARADLLVPAAVSILAFGLVIVFFAPRFYYWQWLDLDPAEHHPSEFNRALDTLRQLENPMVRVTNPTNRVVNWRLLFPVLGHYLHLPRWAFLGLPAVGCLLVLGYVARLVRRESAKWWVAVAAAALSGTTSWFFVSTGWLAYFDSWCLLGMLVAAFGRSKVATGLACLLTPWVDERFVLTLPLIVAVRMIAAGGIEGGSAKRVVSDGLRFLALVLPYCAIRLIALGAAQDEGSAGHLRSHFATVHNAWQVADGLWSGLRALWLFVALAPGLLLWKGRAGGAGLLTLAIVVTLVANLSIAHDFSRSASTVIPAAVLGIVLLLRAGPKTAGWLVAAALVCNLLTPARHVIEGWDRAVTIFPLHFELYRIKHPTSHVVSLYLLRATKLAERGQISAALAETDTALAIAPGSIGVRINRGNYLNALGRSQEAAACYDAAIALAPQLPEAYRRRARFLLEHGQVAAAEEDLRRAVDLSPKGSLNRAALEEELALVRRARNQR